MHWRHLEQHLDTARAQSGYSELDTARAQSVYSELDTARAQSVYSQQGRTVSKGVQSARAYSQQGCTVSATLHVQSETANPTSAELKERTRSRLS